MKANANQNHFPHTKKFLLMFPTRQIDKMERKKETA